MRIQIVGGGRMGAALHAGLQAAGRGTELLPIAGRGATGSGADLVLLAVPDAALTAAAACISPGPLVGHLSGMTTLAALAPHEALSIHPLLTVTGAATRFDGAYAAVAGSSERARAAAAELAAALGLTTFTVADADRAGYHAAASLAANSLVALEWTAERLAATAGVPREALAPLARAALENWAERGAFAALTGPIARGDEATLAGQRAAVAERLPAELALFDALTATTRALAAAAADPDPSGDPAPEPSGSRDPAPERTGSRDPAPEPSASRDPAPTDTPTSEESR